MRISVAYAMSVNGKVTNGSDAHAHTWTSNEDWEEFQKLRDSYEVIVMGRTTYDSVRPKPEATLLRIVLTHTPEKYQSKAVRGQLEFINASPEQLIDLLERRGFSRLLFVSSQASIPFWAAGLIDEVYITVEPLIFGKGRDLIEGVELDGKLRLQSAKQLNKRGTTVLHYFVDKTASDI